MIPLRFRLPHSSRNVQQLKRVFTSSSHSRGSGNSTRRWNLASPLVSNDSAACVFKYSRPTVTVSQVKKFRFGHTASCPGNIMQNLLPSPQQEEQIASAVTQAPAVVATVSTLQKYTDAAAPLVPGVALSGAVLLGSGIVADGIGGALATWQGIAMTASPISAVPIAILSGIVVNNVVSLPASVKPGLKFCTTTILRAGIVCIGIKLSMLDLVQLGSYGLPIVVGSIGAGLAFVPWLNNKLNLPTRLGFLIAAGSSICGVTAIASVAPVIKADEKEVALAVANVALFGTVGMLFYPYLAHTIFDTPEQIGLFLGTAIHDTSQVMGAAMSYVQVYGEEVALQTAAVTKLTRNLFLAAVIPGLAWYSNRASGGAGGKNTASWKTLFPTFILGFILMALFRTSVDSYIASNKDSETESLIDAAEWKRVTKFLGDDVAKAAMGTAMAGLGLSTSLSVFKGVGARAFLVGWAGALVVGGVGCISSYLLAPLMIAQKEEKER